MPDSHLGPSRQTPRHRSPEAYRILIAAHKGGIEQNENGRYIIRGQERPDFKVRKDLESRGFIQYINSFVADHPRNIRASYRLTPKGADLLAELDKEAHEYALA